LNFFLLYHFNKIESNKCFTIDQAGLNAFLEEKHSEMLENLNAIFLTLKTDFIKIAEEKLKPLHLLAATSATLAPPAPLSYSQTLKNKSQPAVIIKPKKPNQDVSVVKSDINSKINPIESKLNVTKVKTVNEGGLLIGFSSKEDNARFKRVAVEKLGADYDIYEVKGILSRIKVVGMTQIYKENEIVDFVDHSVNYNYTGTELNPECKLIKLWPTKKNPKIYQAVIQVDRPSYDKLIQAGGLFIGYDYCYTFDAVEVLRCYNCNGYHHTSKSCKNKKSCPRCGVAEKLDHTIAECKASTLKCVNCVNLVKNEKLDLDVNHAAWDNRCPMYQRAIEKLKKDLLLKQ
jgi:hypothetical protein